MFIFSSCGFLDSYINEKNSSLGEEPVEPVFNYSITPVFPSSLNATTGENSTQIEVVVQVTSDVVSTALTASSLFQVYINDVLATLKADTTNYYAATIPITTGTVQINVDIRKNNLSVHTSNTQIRNQSMTPFASSVYGIGISPDKSKAYVVGWNQEVTEVVLATGARRIVTNFSKGIGSGPNIIDLIQAIAIDSSGTMAYLGGNSFGTYSLNLVTGERAYHSRHGTRGTGPTMSWPNGIVIDSTDTYMYVVESFGRFITRVEVATGDRSLASSDGRAFGHAVFGAGPNMENLRGALLSGDESTLYTYDLGTATGTVLAINLSNGDRTVISRGGGSPVGTGPDLQALGLKTINTLTNEVFLYGSKEIYKVDLATGNRTIISRFEDQVGNGLGFESLNGMTGDPANGFLYPIDYAGEIFKVEISSGNRNLIKELSIGTGPDVLNMNDAHINSTKDKIYFSTPGGIYFTVPSSGARNLVSNFSQGSGTNFGNIVAMALNSDSTFAYVLDRGTTWAASPNALFKVNLQSGDRTIVSSASVGTGPNITINNSLTLAIDSTETFAYFSDSATDEIIQVNLSNGNRTVISSSVVGTGTAMSYVMDTMVSPDDSILYASDATLKVVFAIDIATGNRTIISSASVGSGANFANVYYLAKGLQDDHIFVSTGSKLVKVVLATGDRSDAFDGSVGNGIKTTWFAKFNSILPDKKFYAPLAGGMGEYDLLSGARVIFSR